MTVLPDRPGPFYARLDALRGIAALLVAGMHASQARWGEGRYLFQPLPDSPHPVWEMFTMLMRYLLNGHGAVILFFVLSGFVLSLSLERGPLGFFPSARRFFIARAFRLFPAAVVTVVVFALLFLTLGAAIPGVTPSHYSVFNLLRNALLLDTSINGVMWTLQIEVLAAPLVFSVYHLRRRFGETAVIVLSLLFAILLFSKRWSGLINPQINSLGGSFAFLFGMLVPTLGRRFAERLSGRSAALTGTLTVLMFFFARAIFRYRWSMIAEGWAGAAFIALLVYGPPLRGYRALDLGIVRFYGKISYSFYLFHPLTLMVIWKMPGTIDSWIEAGVPSSILILGLWIATSAVVTPIAAACYKWVEWPAMKVGRRFAGAGIALPTAVSGIESRPLSRGQTIPDE